MYRLLVLLAILSVSACSREAEVTDSSDQETGRHDATIEWFDGSIDAAFDVAASTEKPLFLYWGAVWCPPCQEIKYTVFKSQDFINLTRLFVPVYLDGDTDRAQAWGEKFGVKGYPTMIVFNPAGEEMTRIPGGIDISRYNTVLELSLNQMRSTSSLVQLAVQDASQLSPDEFYQLAYYSWFQDASALPDDVDDAALFLALSDSAPQGELGSRFFMLYLLALADANEEESPVTTNVDVAGRLAAILGSDELTLATWDTAGYYMEEIMELPVFTDEQRDQLEAAWAERTFGLRFAGSLSKAEKMAGWFPKLQLLTRDDAKLPEDLASQLRKELAAIDKATPDSYERQSVINQMSHVYRTAGLNEDAQDLLEAELQKSASPYYFMSGLASMAEKDGNPEQALRWRKQAYEESTGEATRFQWGTNYVSAMIRLSPDNDEEILHMSTSLLGEFSESSELFAGRNFRVLKRLNSNLLAWQEEREVNTEPFRLAVQQLCDGQAEDSPQKVNCQSLNEEGAEVKVARAG